MLDSGLAGRAWLAAVQPTIADICCYSEAAFAQLCDFDIRRWPNIHSWAGRIAGLPGFAAPFDLLAMSDREVSG